MELTVIIAIFVLLSAGMIAFTFTDLSISDALYTHDSFFGKAFAYIGEIPAYIIVACFFAVLFFYFKKTILKCLAACLTIVSNFFWTYRTLKFIDNSALFYSMNILLAVVTTVLLIFIFSKLDKTHIKKLLIITLFASIFIIADVLVVQVFKTIVGRVRYRNLNDVNIFTPWYKINGINEHKSFPSGHTAAACSLMSVYLLVKEFNFKRPLKYAVLGASVVFILCTALSRIVIGAHYATDVTFSMIMSLALFLATYFAYKKFIQKNAVNANVNDVST